MYNNILYFYLIIASVILRAIGTAIRAIIYDKGNAVIHEIRKDISHPSWKLEFITSVINILKNVSNKTTKNVFIYL